MDNDDLFAVFERPSEAASTPPPSTAEPPKSTGKGKGKKTLAERLAGNKRSSLPDSSEKGDGEEDAKKKKSGDGDGETDAASKKDASAESKDSSLPPQQQPKDETDEVTLAEVLPRITVHKVETLEACTHEVAVPPGGEYHGLKQSTTEPAKTYPFILDPFQKESVLCIENNQSVLVSAHTSAGKTVVAEYAIAMCLRDKQRVIYTSPIKALSNQKFRELTEEFTDVGLMTGDVTINPTASCLVMTTEILRSMLYRGSEVTREVAWVVFDEIHYMRDKERGVVWEETLILLPDNVHYVFLSATIPNARQFAEWIAYLKKQPCHVVYTEYRPTPLQHYIFPAGGDGLFMVVDEQSNFKEDNFNTAMSVLKTAGDAAKGDSGNVGRKGGTKGESNCYKIVKMIMEKQMQPVIVFSFSRKECEAYGMQMSKLDFNTEQEKTLVEEIFNNAMDQLTEADKQLPQVLNILPLLKRGIGIHHSGLLPILKETIEILFGEGFIKALFATETFAMGLNMPARTVLFTSARKFDGKDHRWLASGEFIQMSGRAGRRGIDSRGLVILMVDEKMSPGVCKDMVRGQANKLDSAFHLTYNMVLNLLRVEEINPEFMLERSFFQFQNYAAIPEMVDNVKKLETDFKQLQFPQQESVGSYHRLRSQLDQFKEEMLSYIRRPQYILPFLQPGRCIKVTNGTDEFGWGVVINFQKKADNQKKQQDPLNTEPVYIVDTLLNLSKESAARKDPTFVKPCPAGEKGEMCVIPVLLDIVQAISSVRLYFPKDLKSLDNRQSVGKSLQEVQRRFPDGLPLLDPLEDMGIKEQGLKDVIRRIDAFENRMFGHALHEDPEKNELLVKYAKQLTVSDKIRAEKSALKKARSLLQMDELKCRKRVLRRLGYATASDVIEIKGRVACEISSGDELVITELLFNGVFNDLSPEHAAALLSCFVFEERAQEMPKLGEELSGALRLMQETARKIAKVSKEAKLEIDEETYVEKFKPHMMDVVYAWSTGKSFAEICQMTDIFEGSIIRTMRRLEELLRQMCQAAKAIGNTELENKFADSIVKIKRDIVFAASLYL